MLNETSLLHNHDNINIDFTHPMQSLSWTILGGGWKVVDKAYWLKVTNRMLTKNIDPIELLKERIPEAQQESTLGFMTSASLDTLSKIKISENDIDVNCFTTLGLNNALRVGDPVQTPEKTGTINTLCLINIPLSLEASIESVSIMTEAKTLALIEHKIKSYETNLPATGTGTDCSAIVSKLKGHREQYAGKHTLAGKLIGKAVYMSVCESIAKWNPQTGMYKDYLKL